MRAWFTLDRIEVDAQCAKPSENGHMIALTFSVDTTPLLDPAHHWFITPQHFAIVGPDGVTDTNVATAAAYGCLDSNDHLPRSAYAPSSKYSGRIALDSRYASGLITYRPGIMAPGWEWPFPST
ncbi:hypothetical protein [Actinosynnema sp. NPDC023587]|uniref:hypothetical protein n=1 Tax=Actinosynnema sp. NPDC023587 TaxID=3154695 RepID=UPI0033C780BE